jgi:hypothetical protein
MQIDEGGTGVSCVAEKLYVVVFWCSGTGSRLRIETALQKHGSVSDSERGGAVRGRHFVRMLDIVCRTEFSLSVICSGDGTGETVFGGHLHDEGFPASFDQAGTFERTVSYPCLCLTRFCCRRCRHGIAGSAYNRICLFCDIGPGCSMGFNAGCSGSPAERT